MPRGRTTGLNSGPLLPSWGPRLSFGRACSQPSCETPSRSFSSCHAASNHQSEHSSPVCLALLILFFFLGTTHSRDSTFWTRMNVAELVGLLNSRPNAALEPHTHFPPQRIRKKTFSTDTRECVSGETRSWREYAVSPSVPCCFV